MTRNISRLLVVTTRSWTSIEPFLRALERAGFSVALVHGQAGGHALHDTSIALYLAGPLQFRHTIEFVMEDLSPDLVVPTDETSFQHLRALYAMRSEGGRLRSPIARTIAKSLGDPETWKRISSLTELGTLARDHGLPVPYAVEIKDEAVLRSLLQSSPLPAMLKSDGGWAGSCTEIVDSGDAGIAAYHRISGKTRLWHEPRDCNSDLIAPRPCAVWLQQHIAGVAVTRSVACRDGRVLAGISAEPLKSGPTLAAKIISDAALDDVTLRLVKLLNLSGIAEFDFILEHRTGKPWLIAVKPYATPMAQLVAAGGVGLPDALYAGFCSAPIRLEPVEAPLRRLWQDGLDPRLPVSLATEALPGLTRAESDGGRRSTGSEAQGRRPAVAGLGAPISDRTAA
jgi:hypothetical protein